MLEPRTYRQLLRQAQKRSRRVDEAGDLLQTALLLAFEKRRSDMTRPENRRWLCGVLRNLAALEGRSAARRRQREHRYAEDWTPDEVASRPADPEARVVDLVAPLPAALRTTALLALTGHTKAEICWLLNLSDGAFRKRVSDLKKRWRAAGVRLPSNGCGPAGDLAFGVLRRSLIARVRDRDVQLASHDPDGHLLIVRSQQARSRQQRVSDH